MTMLDHAILMPNGTVILERPLRCSGCGTMHYWFVNAGGRTRCVMCNEKENR